MHVSLSIQCVFCQFLVTILILNMVQYPRTNPPPFPAPLVAAKHSVLCQHYDKLSAKTKGRLGPVTADAFKRTQEWLCPIVQATVEASNAKAREHVGRRTPGTRGAAGTLLIFFFNSSIPCLRLPMRHWASYFTKFATTFVHVLSCLCTCRRQSVRSRGHVPRS